MIWQKGLSMIEVLLVISIAALIILLGLQRYRGYWQVEQYTLVKNDVQTILQALNQFYNTIPCDSNGIIVRDLNRDVLDQLKLPYVLSERAPYISNYTARIIDSGARTEKKNKPVYQIEVTAELEPAVSNVMWFFKKLDATYYHGRTLYWVNIPNTSLSDAAMALTPLNISREQFKQALNGEGVSEQIVTHAYCAR